MGFGLFLFLPLRSLVILTLPASRELAPALLAPQAGRPGLQIAFLLSSIVY
jgi:hypothetical protein